MPEKKPFEVKVGNSRLRVAPHAKGWRFGYRDGARWRYVTRKTKREATEAAQDHLRDAGTGLVWSSLPVDARAFLEAVHARAGDENARRAVLDFLATREASCLIGEAVSRFCAAKELEAGGKTRHLGQVRSFLEATAARFEGKRMAEVSGAELLEWWHERGGGMSPKRRRDLRGMLVTFWSWAKREGMVVDAYTAADRLPSPKVGHGSKRVLTPAELVRLLNSVSREFRAWAVLGAWAGLRPEEIAPQAASNKPGLRCEHIDWTFGVIRVPAEVANKVRRPRVVPMCDALKRGLRWAGIKPGMVGPVCPRDPVRAEETRKLGRLVFDGKWPQDALRHSFGSYRNAVLRNLPQVAEEMGTSVAMLDRHYHNPRAEAEGVAWFGVVLKSSDSEKVFVTPDEVEKRPSERRIKA